MSTDVIDFAMRINQPRGELWHLLAQPQWYPRFFCGIGSITRVFDPSAPHGTEAYRARVGGGPIPVRDIGFRIRESRLESDFTLEGIDEGWFASVRLTDLRNGGTKVTVAVFRAGLIHEHIPVWDKPKLSQWLKDGIARAVDYLAGKPTAAARNSGELPFARLNVLRTMMATGAISALRPDRLLRMMRAVGRYGYTLAAGYATAAGQDPTGIAIVDDYGSHTYERVHLRSEWIAAGLHARGVEAGRTVAVLARNHAGTVETVVACGKLGVNVVMVNTGMSARQVDELVAVHQLAAVLLDDEFDDLVYNLPGHIMRVAIRDSSLIPGRTTLTDLIGDTTRTYLRPRTPGRVILLTSGSSGSHKSALRPEPRNLMALASLLSKLPLRANERMLIAAPLFHMWGFGLLHFSAPLRGTAILQDRFEPETCLAAIARYRCTSLVAVPIMLQRILDLPPYLRAHYDTSSMQTIVSSGSALPGPLAGRVMDTFGEILYNLYGSTEVSWGTVAGPTDLRVAPTTAGRPPLGTKVAILGPGGETMPVGAVGRIFVGHELLFDGYLNATDPKISHGMMSTGDLGYIDTEGRLFVSGRDDEMIISGGENVFPRPVEDALAMLPQIDEVAVIGVPDDEFGQRLAAFVVPHAGKTLDPEALRQYLRHRLNRFSVPRDFLFLDALPRNATGKILKRVLVGGDCA